jgi:hypothetical protein
MNQEIGIVDFTPRHFLYYLLYMQLILVDYGKEVVKPATDLNAGKG